MSLSGFSYGLKTCQQPPHPFVIVAHFDSPCKSGSIGVLRCFAPRVAEKTPCALDYDDIRNQIEGLGAGLKAGNSPTREHTSVQYYIVVRICGLLERKEHSGGAKQRPVGTRASRNIQHRQEPSGIGFKRQPSRSKVLHLTSSRSSLVRLVDLDRVPILSPFNSSSKSVSDISAASGFRGSSSSSLSVSCHQQTHFQLGTANMRCRYKYHRTKLL